MPKPYTLESVNEQANEHFNALLERPYLLRLTAEEAEVSVSISRKLLEAALAVPVGETLKLDTVIDWDNASDAERQYLLGSLPFVVGCLGVLSMEFSHETAGVLPAAPVRQLLEGAETVEYEGVFLTASSVNIQYRRLYLAA